MKQIELTSSPICFPKIIFIYTQIFSFSKENKNRKQEENTVHLYFHFSRFQILKIQTLFSIQFIQIG